MAEELTDLTLSFTESHADKNLIVLLNNTGGTVLNEISAVYSCYFIQSIF